MPTTNSGDQTIHYPASILKVGQDGELVLSDHLDPGESTAPTGRDDPLPPPPQP